ncbi:MAG: nuclear transport factor 2 family protein, partial [Chitinophagaceae bacterium]|nr:nuclear transport factor 2 family protein [Chitinophagaceae bacterium]
MKSTKAKELKIAYERLINVSLVDMSSPLRWIDQCFADTIIGFGTAKDEKINSLEELRQLIKNGRKQSRIFTSFHVKKLTPYRPTYTSEDVAVFSDEFLVSTKLGNESFQLHLFFTCVFQYFGKSWKCISFHGSAPPDGSTTEDTFHMDESKKRIIELEDKVAERTFQLSQKNQELQLEASLEKVRTASWMMKGADELVNLVAVLFSELGKLGFDLDGGAIVLNIFDHQTEDITQWIIDANHQFPYSFKHPHFDNPILNDIRNAKKNGVKYFSNTYSRSVKNAFWNFYFSNTDFQRFPKKLQKEILSKPSYAQCMALGKNTAILNPNINGVILETNQQYILQRFANVFEQSYSRFLDLQKAEAQAREALVEAALERVRSRSMAMHKSEEFPEVIQVVLDQFVQLDFKIDAAQFDVEFRETDDLNLWSATPEHPYPTKLHVPYADNEVFNSLKKAKKDGHDFAHVQLTKQQKNKFFEYFFLHVPNITEDRKKLILSSPGMARSVILLDKVSLGIQNYSGIPYSDEEHAIIKRFAKVFEQTYTRFIDLQKAEASAIQSKKQAAIDRIRAEVAAMRTKQDLDFIIPIIWRELSSLSIPFTRCGIFIMDDDKRQISVFLSTPDGKSLAAFELDYHTEMFSKALQSWQKKEIFVAEWGRDEFSSLATMIRTDDNTQHQYYSSGIPADQLSLHFVPFLQGILYVGNTSMLSESQLEQIQSIAAALSAAYARYEDFRKLEAAKQQIEKTLLDLQATQKQLVQAEKMASLGELTAGIAHEIQNPLNFVNNFAEVNTELIDELKKEIEPAGIISANELIEDIKANSEKITHHGKRADAIVKSMLQHSRKTSGQKELTDINALCDEYLRLSYHGLRAKDKSFNAEFETKFDAALAPINVVPQDIGRVILNLINNAFYAVNERQKNEKESG